MIYLSGSVQEKNRDELIAMGVGLMIQPGNNYHEQVHLWPYWAADNGCFADRWEAEKWEAWLYGLDTTGCLFAVAPDVLADHDATMRRSPPYLKVIRAFGFPAAFVMQDGATSEALPWGLFDVLFIGGTTQFKFSPEVAHAVLEAKRRGMWTHVGRVNSHRRYAYCAWLGADSADGTYLKHGPDILLPKLKRWLEKLEHQPVLEFGYV